MDLISKKNTGSFYTCNSIADFITEWAIDDPNMCVLEPSFGDGIFIDAALKRFSLLGNDNPQIIGVEIQPEPFYSYIGKHNSISGYLIDFMDYKKTDSINAIIGNPPYIRLKNLNEQDRKKALNIVSTYGVEMLTSGSLWMPFIIHATELLDTKGKLGFVLPYEITHVRYAFNLWNYLANNYGKLTICRIFHDFFPDVDVETIVLLADNKGSSTKCVEYKVFQTISDLFDDKAYQVSFINIKDITSLQKPFERDLIPNTVTSLLEMLREEKKLTPFVNDCKFKIGYVSGNKAYFHVSEDILRRYNINQTNIRKCIINAKQISSNQNIGIETKNITDHSYLFYPVDIGQGEQEYINYGEANGVSKGYKCRVRNPWYLTPGLELPDLILTVFGDVPRLLLNDGKYYVSNSLLSGFSKTENKKELLCRWYNSLTLLSIEATIHSLGGGTLVLIPGETDKLEVINDFPKSKIDAVYDKLTRFARDSSTNDIYSYGDTIVLEEIYGFSKDTINQIRETITILRKWRNPDKRRG